MTTPRPTVRLATFEDAEPIADLLADAFLDYEWSRWLFLPTTAANASAASTALRRTGRRRGGQHLGDRRHQLGRRLGEARPDPDQRRPPHPSRRRVGRPLR